MKKKIIGKIIVYSIIIISVIISTIIYNQIRYLGLGNDIGVILGFLLATFLILFIFGIDYLMNEKLEKRKDND